MTVKSRMLWLWILLTLSTVLLVVALGVVLHSFWKKDLDRIEQEQSARAIELSRQIEDTLAGVEQSIARELAGFHFEGLIPQLEQWEASSDLVRATFVWTAQTGDFWTSERGSEPLLHSGQKWIWEIDPTPQSARRYPVEPSQFGATYLADNLEDLRYRGEAVAPVIGWWISPSDPTLPWICWHRLGPNNDVRGCLVDPAPILDGLRSILSQDPLGAVGLRWRQEERGPSSSLRRSINDPLPLQGTSVASVFTAGYKLELAPTESMIATRQYHRILWMVVVGIVLLFLLGVLLIVRQTRRDTLEARRRVTFVSQVSHELRTPLTSIRLFADMLDAEEVPNDKRHRFALSIGRESRRLTDLIERILTFNTVETGTGRYRRESIDVIPLILESLEEMQPIFNRSELEVRFDDPGSPLCASTDSSVLKQVLINLLDNAVKYAATGKYIHLALETDDDQIRLSIRDQGPGIPRALRAQIFEPFVQGSRELHTKTPGVGLGLSISRGMLRTLNADLTLGPSTIHGATFIVHLPRPQDI